MVNVFVNGIIAAVQPNLMFFHVFIYFFIRTLDACIAREGELFYDGK